MAGLVFAGERKIAKPGEQLTEDVALDVRGRDHSWVSRGGVKLAHGLDHFEWDVAGAVAIDVGSSTGRVHRRHTPARRRPRLRGRQRYQPACLVAADRIRA